MFRTDALKKISPYQLLWVGIGLYIIVFTVLTLWKYSHFYYDNLDLAIFNNVFWNTLHANWFEASIHPSSYFGDHFSPGIILLLPLYTLLPRPEILLILQTVAIAVSALPLYLIAKRMLGLKYPYAPLFIAGLWLCNPLVHNMNFFEFELMAFAVLGLLWALWAYIEDRQKIFVLATLATLSMREDFVFILCMFSVVALLEKRSNFWRYYPIITSLLWGAFAFTIIGLFAPEGSYKFLRYYGWLGGSGPLSIAWSFLSHPWQVLRHLTTFYNMEFILGLTFPLFFFISLRDRWALLLIPPTAQIMLAGFGGSGVLLGTYYAAYIVALLFVLFIHRFGSFDPQQLPRWIPIELRSRQILYGIIVLATVYSAGAYGSVLPAVTTWSMPNLIEEKQDLIKQIPKDAAVATTYDLLPTLSSRQYVYLFPYAAIGKNQFALRDYPLPENTEYLLIDWDDMVLAQMHFSQNKAFAPFADNVSDSLSAILKDFTLVDARHSLTLWKRSTTPGSGERLATVIASQSKDMLSIQRLDPRLQASIAVPAEDDHRPAHYYLEISAGDEQTRVPLGYGLIEESELGSDKTLMMPLFLDPNEDAVITLHRWSKGSIELTGIKTIGMISDAKEIARVNYNATR